MILISFSIVRFCVCNTINNYRHGKCKVHLIFIVRNQDIANENDVNGKKTYAHDHTWFFYSYNYTQILCIYILQNYPRFYILTLIQTRVLLIVAVIEDPVSPKRSCVTLLITISRISPPFRGATCTVTVDMVALVPLLEGGMQLSGILSRPEPTGMLFLLVLD